MLKRILSLAAAAGALGLLALALAVTYRFRAGLTDPAQADTVVRTGAPSGQTSAGKADGAAGDTASDAAGASEASADDLAPPAVLADPAVPVEDVLVTIADGTSGTVESGPGIVVSALVKDGPAARAGVRRGDIVLAVGGRTVDRLADIHRALADRQAGDAVVLKVLRGDDEVALTATLDEAHGRLLGIVPCAPGGAAIRMVHGPLHPGARVEAIAAGGPAAAAGLRPGDVIASVDGQAVDAEHPLGDLIAARKPGDRVALTVHRAEETRRDDGAGGVTVEATVEPVTVTATLGEKPDSPGAAYLGVTYADGPVVRVFEGDDAVHGTTGHTFTWRLDSGLGRFFGHGDAPAIEVAPLPDADAVQPVAPQSVPSVPGVPAIPPAPVAPESLGDA